LEFAANVGGVFGAEVSDGGAVAIGSLDDYSLRLYIERRKLLLVPLSRIIIARINPHLHLRVQPGIDV